MVSRWVVILARRFGRPKSFASKLRRPLFEESADALTTILREETAHLFSYFILQGVCQRLFAATKQGLLDGADGQRRALGNFLRKSSYFRFELRRRHNMIHDSQTQRGFRVDHVAGIKKLGGFRWPDQLWQEISTAIVREEPNFRKVLAEHGFFGGDADVRCKSDIHSRTGGCAVDRGNDRLGHSAHFDDNLHSFTEQRLEFLGRAAGAALANQP